MQGIEFAYQLLTLSQGNCSSFQCNGTSTNGTFWDILNPVLFFTDENSLCEYADINICCTLDGGSADDGQFFSFLKPFCLDLLPFCIFYSFMRVIISIINYYFIFKKKIEDRISKGNQELLIDKSDKKKYSYMIYFKNKLRFSFLVDIANAVVSFSIFKGYQFYASQFYINPQGSGLVLLGNYYQRDDMPALIVLSIAVFLWFLTECCQVYIQIFSVSTLTHLDNLVRERLKNNEDIFYRKHHKWALWWTGVFFIIGFALLGLTFYWKPIHMGDKDVENNFVDYKLFYKYYSTSTVTFWLCYTLVLILVLTDRLLSYEGFKKREEFRTEGRNRSQIATTQVTHIDNYQIQPESRISQRVVDTIRKKFPEKAPEEIKTLADKLINIYNQSMKDHLGKLSDQLNANSDEPPIIGTSMSYVRYLRYFNIFILIGYVMVLVSYKQLEESASLPSSSLPLYLCGFIISSVATFAYELTHNYLLYRSYFLQILSKVN